MIVRVLFREFYAPTPTLSGIQRPQHKASKYGA